MSFQRLFSTVLFGALSFGCVATSPVESGDIEELEEQSLTMPGPGGGGVVKTIISMNGLPPGLITDPANQALMASLRSGSLHASTPLLDTPNGRLIFGHLVLCALPEGGSIVVTDKNGEQYEFDGLVNLASHWQYGAISKSDGRWISACLLAHANAYGTAVSIFLHGSHDAIQEAPPAGYTEQEAGFYGDVFNDGSMFACIGSDASSVSGTQRRICGRSTVCGFTLTGTCLPGTQNAVCTGGPDIYGRCATNQVDATIDEVITVYTQQGIFMDPNDCPHSPFEVGFPLPRSCGSVESKVCLDDAYCCEVEWDQACVDHANSLQ